MGTLRALSELYTPTASREEGCKILSEYIYNPKSIRDCMCEDKGMQVCAQKGTTLHNMVSNKGAKAEAL